MKSPLTSPNVMFVRIFLNALSELHSKCSSGSGHLAFIRAYSRRIRLRSTFSIYFLSLKEENASRGPASFLCFADYDEKDKVHYFLLAKNIKRR